MTRQVGGSNVTVEVLSVQTGAPLAGVIVPVAPNVYTDPEFTSAVSSLTSGGDGACRFYATPGVYVFTPPAQAAAIESVEVLGQELGSGRIDGGAP